MKYLASLFLLCLGATLVCAETVEERVKAALEYAKKPAATCQCGPNCTCVSGECGDPNCPTAKTAHTAGQAPGPLEEALYRIQYQKAISQNKPLLIWVGETCPSCEAAWTEVIHARLSEYDGPSGKIEKGPCVIVGKPDGFGGLTRVATLRGIPSKLEIDNLVVAGFVLEDQRRVQHAPSWVIPPAAAMRLVMYGGSGGMPTGGGFGGGGGGSC